MKSTIMRCARQIARVTEARNIDEFGWNFRQKKNCPTQPDLLVKQKCFCLQQQLHTSNIKRPSGYSYIIQVASKTLILDILLYMQQVFWCRITSKRSLGRGSVSKVDDVTPSGRQAVRPSGRQAVRPSGRQIVRSPQRRAQHVTIATADNNKM